MSFVFLVLLSVVLFVVQQLLTPKPDLEDARPNGLGDFNFPTATEARAVPVVHGSNVLRGPNVIWYGDLEALPIRKKIKTGLFSSTRQTIGYQYRIGIDFLLCHGVIDELFAIDVQEEEVWPNGGATLTTRTLDVEIDEPTHFDSDRGGIVGAFDFYPGTNEDTDPNVSQYLADQLVGGDLDSMPAYVDVSHVVWKGPSTSTTVTTLVEPPSTVYPNGLSVTTSRKNGYVGNSESIAPWAFYVRRFPNQLGVAGGIERIGDDANPACVLYEVLTDEVWGLGVPTSDIDTAAFQAAAQTLFDEGNGFSMVWTRKNEARNYVTEIIRQADAAMFENADGELTLVLAREPTAGELAAAVTLDPTNVKAVKEFTRASWAQTANHVQIKYEDRGDAFKSTSAVAQDLANYQLQGNRDVVQEKSYPGVKTAALAQAIAARDLRVASFPLLKVTLECNREASGLTPGGIAKFTWPELGITDKVLRIGSIDDGGLDKQDVEVRAIEDVFALGNPTIGLPPGTNFVTPNTDPVALGANVQHVAEVPGCFPQLSLFGFSPSDFEVPEFMALAIREDDVALGVRPHWNAVPTFGDDATEVAPYQGDPLEALNPPFAPGGTILNAIGPSSPLLIPEIELATATQELVDLYNEVGEVATTASGKRAGVNLAIIGSQNAVSGSRTELVAYENLQRNPSGSYSLVNVSRALWDTVPNSFVAGEEVWLLADPNAVYFTEAQGALTPANGATLASDHRLQTIYPGGDLIVPDNATEVARRIRGSGSAGGNADTDGTRQEKPLPPFNVLLRVDPNPTVPPTTDIGPAFMNRFDFASHASVDVAGALGAIDCRLEVDPRPRVDGSIRLWGDSGQVLNAANEPASRGTLGGVPYQLNLVIATTSDPATYADLAVPVNTTVAWGGSTTTTIDFTVPAVVGAADWVNVLIRIRRNETGGGWTPGYAGSNLLQMLFRRVA